MKFLRFLVFFLSDPTEILIGLVKVRSMRARVVKQSEKTRESRCGNSSIGAALSVYEAALNDKVRELLMS